MLIQQTEIKTEYSYVQWYLRNYKESLEFVVRVSLANCEVFDVAPERGRDDFESKISYFVTSLLLDCFDRV